MAFGFADRLTVALDFLQFLSVMALDKKNQKGQVHMSLLQGIGQMYHQDGAYSFAIAEETLCSAYQVLSA